MIKKKGVGRPRKTSVAKLPTKRGKHSDVEPYEIVKSAASPIGRNIALINERKLRLEATLEHIKEGQAFKIETRAKSWTLGYLKESYPDRIWGSYADEKNPDITLITFRKNTIKSGRGIK